MSCQRSFWMRLLAMLGFRSEPTRGRRALSVCRPQAMRRRPPIGMRRSSLEGLQPRLAPAVFAFGPDGVFGTLTISQAAGDGVSGASDTVSVGVNGSNEVTVTINASTYTVARPGGGNVKAADVEDIVIDTSVSGNGGNDTVDLRNVVLNPFPAGLQTDVHFDGSANSNNTFQGSPFDDTVDGADGNDVMYGYGGNDQLTGDGGADQLNGGDGNDRLEGSDGNDTLAGGAGDDDYEFDPGALGSDTLTENANEGADSLDFSDFNVAISATLASTGAQAIGSGGSTVTITLSSVSNFENIYAANGAFNDTLTGNTAVNVLAGRSGNDTITGGDGNDVIEGGDGADTLRGGNGDDTINAGAGNDTTVEGEAGNDYLAGDGYSDPTVLAALSSPTGGPTINEASGIVLGRTSTQIMWSIEDGGNGVELFANLFSGASAGASRGYYTLQGSGFTVSNNDWEDMAFYRDGSTNYLYIADIGDNHLSRSSYTIYRVAEPSILVSDMGTGSRGTLTVTDRIQLQYPSAAARNSETLMVDPLTGDIYTVSKTGEAAGANAHLYRVAKPSATDWSTGATLSLTDQGAVAFAANTPNDSPSGGDISPSGLQVLLKSDDTIKLFVRETTGNSLTTLLTTKAPVQLPNAKDPGNREAIAWATDSATFYTVSEDTGSGAQPIHQYSLGSGADIVSGGADNDTVYGGAGADTLYGGDGNDFVYGAALLAVGILDSDDYLFGDAGADQLYGGYGNDHAYGGDGNDWVFGDAGNDDLFGDAGDDNAYGGDGADTMHGGTGADQLYGQAGTDYLYAVNNSIDSAAGDGAYDYLSGGDDLDAFGYKIGEDAASQ